LGYPADRQTNRQTNAG